MKTLKPLREAASKSQKVVAAELGLDYKRYNHYETGRSEPDLATLILLADYYGVTIDYLLGHEKEPTVKDDGLSEIEHLFLSLPPARREEVLRFMEYQASQSSAE